MGFYLLKKIYLIVLSNIIVYTYYIHVLIFILELHIYIFCVMFCRRSREARGNAGKVPRFPEKVGHVLCISFHSAIHSEF